MKTKIFIILFFLLSFNKTSNLFAQNVTADFLIRKLNIDKIYLYTEEDFKDENRITTFSKDTYFDLKNKIWIDPTLKNEDQQFLEELTDYITQIVIGSFINSHNKELMLILHTGSIGCHAENYGRTTFIIIFDDKFNQLSEIGRLNANETYKEKVDINKDGIEEVFFTNEYGMDGCLKKWIDIYSGEFREPKLSFSYFISCAEQGIKNKNFIELNSNYKFEDSSIVFESKIDYYICKGYDNKKERFIKKLLKTKYKRDIFLYKNRKFEHLISKDNVDWDEEGLEF